MTAAQSFTETINRLSTTTDRVIVPDIKRLQYQHSPAAFIFLGGGIDEMFGGGMMSGSAKRTQSGGREVQFQHGVAKNSTAGWMAGPWAKYDTTPQDLNRRSKAEWKHASATRTINLFERLVNRGESELVDIITTESRDAVGSLMETVVEAIYTGTAGGADVITGLDEIISANDTIQSLGGGTYADWNSRGLSARGTAAGSISFAGGSFPSNGVTNWRTAYNNASDGAIRPNVALTDYPTYELYEAQIVPQERYAAPARTGDMSFINLAFKTVPVFPDPFATAGVTYFLNTEYVYLKVLEGADMEFQDWVQAGEQEAITSELVFKGQLCVENRKFVNKVTSQTS